MSQNIPYVPKVSQKCPKVSNNVKNVIYGFPSSDVYGMGVTPDSVNITWSTDGIYWQPSQYQIIYCHKESLSKASLPMFGDKCGETNVTGHKGRHFAIISGLQPFSEYEFKVVGKMEGFAKETFTVANARTSKTFKKWIQFVEITSSSHVNNQT